jgi:predicted transcriptional regulator of viral defense system
MLWRIKGKAEDVHRSDERSIILAALKEASEPLSTREITDLCGMNYEAGRKMLTRMARAGDIDRVGRGLFKMSHSTPCPNSPNIPMRPAICGFMAL